MLVEIRQGIMEGWRRGDIRDLPKGLAADYIRRGICKPTRKKKEQFGQDKSLAPKMRRKGKRPVTKG